MDKTFQRDRVLALLRKSWSPLTSGGWNRENPARGQCNVTALLMHELFGGEILKIPLPEGDHFYNRINGQRVDLTASQFDSPVTYLDLPSGWDEAMAGTGMANYEALKSAFCGS